MRLTETITMIFNNVGSAKLRGRWQLPYKPTGCNTPLYIGYQRRLYRIWHEFGILVDEKNIGVSLPYEKNRALDWAYWTINEYSTV